MVEAKLEENAVLVADPEAVKELYEDGFYGKLSGEKLELALIEALALAERGKIEVSDGKKKLGLNDLFDICRSADENFYARYAVYKDMRERGLPVRMGFKGSDFRVYDRGTKPGKEDSVKWIIFVSSEDRGCSLEQLGKAIKLGQNIRAEALWAVVDDDGDTTYYIIRGLKDL